MSLDENIAQYLYETISAQQYPKSSHDFDQQTDICRRCGKSRVEVAALQNGSIYTSCYKSRA